VWIFCVVVLPSLPIARPVLRIACRVVSDVLMPESVRKRRERLGVRKGRVEKRVSYASCVV